MPDYLNLEDEEIIYYVYNLNWHLPQEIQDEAMEILSEIQPEKVGFIIPKYGKPCWQNGVGIIKDMGYPRNKEALPKLASLLQDRNWPGALEAIETFEQLGKKISVPHIEKECVEAIKCNNNDWLEHLYFATESLDITELDFSNPVTYQLMKKAAEELN
ncbi:hypothetical protein MKY15_11740 [Sporosarcina sp. FSL K6-1540]|uniref:hypothetical protein n=1 Tax=Sporosarcina sp. FSL K6-1540 TaxID=2921555 RepID=UPI00315998BA